MVSPDFLIASRKTPQCPSEEHAPTRLKELFQTFSWLSLPPMIDSPGSVDQTQGRFTRQSSTAM